MPKIVVVRHNTSPLQGERLLRYNFNNRNIARTRVASYEAAMRLGTWRENGETNVALQGDWENPVRLLGGQHTLSALVAAGVTLPLLIAYYVPPETMVTMDAGYTRNFAHDLQREGVPNASNVAAAVRLCYLWTYHDPRDRIAIQRFQLYPFWQEHPEIAEYVRRAMKLRRHIRGSSAVLAAAYWRFAQIDSDDAEIFFSYLEDGSGLLASDPILLLREKFVGTWARQAAPQEQDFVLGYVVTAWNAWRDGRKLRQLNYRHGRGPFPAPV